MKVRTPVFVRAHMSDPDLGGRVYQLRPRLIPPEPGPGRVIPFDRTTLASKPLATVHVLSPRGKSSDASAAGTSRSAERTLDGRSVLDWAWAAHQRVYGHLPHISYLRVVTGADRGRGPELFTSRVAAKAMPDCEEWLETIQLDGRTVLEVFESSTQFTPAPDGHDCDCTCEGGPTHARWEILPEDWRPVRVGPLLQKLARGFSVRVRLAPE